jgi:DNA polymerase-3 subunit alpha
MQLRLIEKNHGIKIDLDTIPLDDTKTFELYQRGDTIGTFQFESAGMQKYLRDLKPDKFDDLIAMNALFRPGPMAYIPKFIDRKFGREAIASIRFARNAGISGRNLWHYCISRTSDVTGAKTSRF